jgi:hypothetical protein
LVNIDWPIKSAYSPCGKYVATGSENSKMYAALYSFFLSFLIYYSVFFFFFFFFENRLVYSEDSGILAHSYLGSALGFTEPATAVAWHPSHHILALCTFGPRAPILVLAKKNPERFKEEKQVL